MTAAPDMMALRRAQIRTLIDLESAESDAWDRGQDAAAIALRKRGNALRNFLALTNHMVPETADAEANRLDHERNATR